MRITVNGEVLDTEKSGTIKELLDELDMDSGRVAVEVNLTIIRRSDYPAFALHNGDRIEIVNFVGGG